MSMRVELADLPAEIEARGPAAFLGTNGPDRPHLASVTVTQVGDQLEVGAGRNTTRNVGDKPGVMLLWPHDATHPDQSLIVDGTATLHPDGERLTITVESAILHRAGGRAPGC